jgi:hypothetical protein
LAPAVVTRFGVSTEEAHKDDQHPGYAQYLSFCEQVGQQALPFGRWSMLSVDFLSVGP